MNKDYLKRGFTMISDRLIWLLLGYKNFLRINYKRHHGYPLNLDHPQSLSEKIQWIKVYGHLERFSKYVDKYAVREFIKARIGEEHLIPLIGCYDRVEDIDLNSLPDSFVMKATHGSSWNIVVKDKTKINWESVKKKMRKWLRANYYSRHGEANYKPLKGRVVIEEYVKDPTGDLKDYKVFCHQGEPVYIRVDTDRFGDHRQDLFDINWNLLPAHWLCKSANRTPSKPEKLDKILDVCRKLTRDFHFVRVDLYYSNDHIYFGELTFTPGDGMAPITPRDFAIKMGELIDIKHYND